MNAPTIAQFTVNIILNDTCVFPNKVADAELHFVDGPLAGLKLTGFAVWESRISSARSVTFPARLYRVHGEPRAYALLRPVDEDHTPPTAHEPIRALILAACRAAETAESASTTDRNDAGSGTPQADRFIVSPWHGEGRSVFYVVDSTAPEDSQPHVVADYPDRESADRHATALNLAEGMASGRVPLTTRQTS